MMRALRRRAGSENAEPRRATPTIPLDADEIRRLFPGAARVTTASLDGRLARLATHGRSLPTLLGALPMLRTHHLAMIQKSLPNSESSRD